MSGQRFSLTPQPLKTSENDVREACLQLLRLSGWWPIRQHVGQFRTSDGRMIKVGVPGDPDYAVLRSPGFFLETKAPEGNLSPVQVERIGRLRAMCGLDTVVVSDVSELKAFLDQRERSLRST